MGIIRLYFVLPPPLVTMFSLATAVSESKQPYCKGFQGIPGRGCPVVRMAGKNGRTFFFESARPRLFSSSLPAAIVDTTWVIFRHPPLNNGCHPADFGRLRLIDEFYEVRI